MSYTKVSPYFRKSPTKKFYWLDDPQMTSSLPTPSPIYYKNSLLGSKNSSPVASKEVLELYYLHLCIIQTPHGIIIYQTDHINDTILSQCFPDAIEKIKSDTTPLKVDSTFELALEKPSEIPFLSSIAWRKATKENPVLVLEIFYILCNISAHISCTTSTVCLDTLMSHMC